jgi:PncC family amidohydrolase
VSEEILKNDGAVSFECAAAMALGLEKSIPAGLHVSVTGIAGPGGGTPEKPAGTVFIGIASEGNAYVFRCLFSGARDEIRNKTAVKALEFILEMLSSGKPERASGPEVVESKVYPIKK